MRENIQEYIRLLSGRHPIRSFHKFEKARKMGTVLNNRGSGEDLGILNFIVHVDFEADV